jgi:hypothetical protein
MSDRLNTEFKNIIDGITINPPEKRPSTPIPADDPRRTGAHLFKKGVSGNPTGRPVGAKQQKTVRQIAEEMNFNPVEAAIMMIREDPRIKKRFKIRAPIETKDKIKLLNWVGDKMYASLKAVDYTVFEGGEDSKPKTIQLYLPEKKSFDGKKEKPVEREVVKLELTPELGSEMIPACDPVKDGK